LATAMCHAQMSDSPAALLLRSKTAGARKIS
jgi:hypothetical protein